MNQMCSIDNRRVAWNKGKVIPWMKRVSPI